MPHLQATAANIPQKECLNAGLFMLRLVEVGDGSEKRTVETLFLYEASVCAFLISTWHAYTCAHAHVHDSVAVVDGRGWMYVKGNGFCLCPGRFLSIKVCTLLGAL